MEGDLDLVLRPLEAPGVAERQAGHAAGEAVDFVVGEKGVFRDVLVLLLAEHHVGGVMEHPLDEHPARCRHESGGVGVLAERDRQTADVVEMAVRDDDEIEALAMQGGQVGCGSASRFLRVEAAIDQNVEIAELDKQRIGADAAIAVQVCELHKG